MLLDSWSTKIDGINFYIDGRKDEHQGKCQIFVFMTSAITGFRKNIPSVHYFIAAALLLLTFFPLTMPFSFPAVFWVKQVLINLMWGGLFYANYYLFTPKLLYKHRTGSFVILVIISVFAVVFFNHWLEEILKLPQAMEKALALRGYKNKGHQEHAGSYITIIMAMVVYGVSTVLALSKKLESDRRAFQTTEKEKITSELSFLKSQINPHFFFNTLHTIYALTDTNTVAAKDAIYTLSHMMRYVIYDTKNDLTSLNKEITFVEDYIKLMRLRLNEDVQIIFEKGAGMKDREVAPMLLLPFVENAFKHGISSIHPSYVYIGIHQSSEQVHIEVRNSLFDTSAHLEESNGIGLANTKRRLDLLYPGQYTLKVERDENAKEHTVSLTLNFK